MSVLLVISTTFAQEFEPVSAEDCLDRFQSNFLNVSKNYAVLGSISVTSIDMPALSKTHEWFAVENSSNPKSKRYFYSESRASYPHAPDNNTWEKRFVSGDKLFLSLGDYLEPLTELKKSVDEDEKKYLSRASIGCPSLFALAILTPTESQMSSNGTHLVSVLNQLVMFEDGKEGNNIVGSFYGSNFVIELTFDRKSGYLPVKSKTYFYNPTKKGAPAPGEYNVLWHESESKWKKLPGDLWVPTHVSSVQHRNSRKSTRLSKEAEATANWDLSIDKSLITDQSIKSLPMTGPIAAVRAKLLEDDNSSKKPSRKK